MTSNKETLREKATKLGLDVGKGNNITLIQALTRIKLIEKHDKEILQKWDKWGGKNLNMLDSKDLVKSIIFLTLYEYKENEEIKIKKSREDERAKCADFILRRAKSYYDVGDKSRGRLLEGISFRINEKSAGNNLKVTRGRGNKNDK